MSTILSWTRAGLLTPHRGPRGAYLFSFQDIALLRAARELLADELPSRRVREALEQLRDQLPPGRPLSAVQVSSLGDRILVRDSGFSWAPGTGQLEMDFSPVEPSLLDSPPPLAPSTIGGGPPAADDWYDRGVDMESTAPEDAKAAYRRALDVDPCHCEAHLNLGRLLHEDGELATARAAKATSTILRST